MEKTKIIGISIALEKHAKKKKEQIWKAMAKEIQKPRKRMPSINLTRIGKLAQQFDKKTLFVPGKILGTGALGVSVFVVGLEFSKNARKKIVDAKGKAWEIKEFLETDPVKSSVVIVK